MKQLVDWLSRGVDQLVRQRRIERKLDRALRELESLKTQGENMADKLEDVSAVADRIEASVGELQRESAEEIALIKDLAGQIANEVDPEARQALKDKLNASADKIDAAVAALDVSGQPPAPLQPPTE